MPIYHKLGEIPYKRHIVFKDKNVDVLINAISRIAENNANIRCIIIGKGIERTHLKRQAERLGLQNNIAFLEPFAEATEVYAYMKAATVFCLPSSREGFGIVSLEALGCNTPVITTNSSANAARHLIQDGQNGSIVPLSPAALAKAIEYWISLPRKPDIAASIADYDWGRIAQKQAEIYAL